MAILTDTELHDLAVGPKSIASGDKRREGHSLADIAKLNAQVGEETAKESSILPIRFFNTKPPGAF